MAVERLTDYTRRIWTALGPDAPEGHDIHVNDVIYYMDSSQCGIVTNVYPEGSIDVEFLPDIGGGGGGGDYTAGDFGDSAKPVGRVVFLGAFIGLQNSNQAPVYFQHRTGMTSFYAPNYNNTANAAATFSNCTNLQYLVLPKITNIYNNFTGNCSNLLAIDILGGSINGSSLQFGNCKKLKTFVIRKTDGVCSQGNVNAFSGTPFANNGSGGTLYVPQALIESYQNATNWSTILAYPNNQILPIEGSIYETQYVDGTPIP